MNIEISKVLVTVGDKSVELTLAEARELHAQLSKLLSADDSALRQILDRLDRMPPPAVVPVNPANPVPMPNYIPPGTPFSPPHFPSWITWCGSGSGVATAIALAQRQ